MTATGITKKIKKKGSRLKAGNGEKNAKIL